MKIITTTWSYDDVYPIQDTFLWKSFIENNSKDQFIHIHYNRSNYVDLEKDFEERFGFQYDYILYKVYLLRDQLSNLLDINDLIFCDATDTVCMGCVNNIKPIQNIIFSTEINQYPSSLGGWGDSVQWSADQLYNKEFLNSGLFQTNIVTFKKILDYVIDNILPLNLKTFGGDQGVYTYHYLSQYNPMISLDISSELFLSTYCRNIKDYTLNDLPLFIHDNGYNYGSPRFIENFNLIN